MQINRFCLLRGSVISIAKYNLKKHKYQALLADHQADDREPPVVRGPQVENRCLKHYKLPITCIQNLCFEVGKCLFEHSYESGRVSPSLQDHKSFFQELDFSQI